MRRFLKFSFFAARLLSFQAVLAIFTHFGHKLAHKCAKNECFKNRRKSFLETIEGMPRANFQHQRLSRSQMKRGNAFLPKCKKFTYLLKNRPKMAQSFFIFQIIFSNKSMKSSILPIFIQFESFLAKLEPFQSKKWPKIGKISPMLLI